MKLSEIVEKLELDIRAGADHLDVEVTRGYASDLMSDVMAHASEGALWITLQTHQNIVAVAVLREMAAIIITGGQTPDDETIKKADKEGIPLLLWLNSSFHLAGRLFNVGVGNPANE